MILKALYDYYDRMGDSLPVQGLEEKEISFIIVIDKEGNFVRIENRMNGKDSQKFLVAKSVKRSNNIAANFLWDNFSYVLGISNESFAITEELDAAKKDSYDKVLEKNRKNHSAFIKKIKEIAASSSDNENIIAVEKFYEKYDDNIIEILTQSDQYDNIKKNITKNVSFLINGSKNIIAEDKDLQRLNMSNCSSNEKEGVCLVTGKKGQITRLFSSTSIAGSQATASIVSFQISKGYDSYYKEQCYNAPISKEAEFKITTSLKYMLRKDSRNKFSIGNRTYLFWTSPTSEATRKVSEEAELGLYLLMGIQKDQDDPNARLKLVKETFLSIYSGKNITSASDKFFFLGLAPNAGRIAIVYWSESNLKDFAGKILEHFNDMEINDTRKEKKPYYGLHQIMATVTLGGKSTEVQPNLPDATMRSIIEGIPYPYSLYTACLRRIRAEQELYITRVSILKAYLNRLNNNNKKITIMLDKENKNQGYLCGRLFATLEYLQERSNGSSNIRGRYLNSASSTPAAVFPTLLNLSIHHEDKLNKGSQIHFENLKGEIMGAIASSGFPAHLDLEDQGRFMIGYYHQRQDFYTSNKEKENNVEQ